VWTCGAGEYGRLGDGGASDSPEFNPTVGIEDKVYIAYIRTSLYIRYIHYTVISYIVMSHTILYASRTVLE
jgi:hypothetical protein